MGAPAWRAAGQRRHCRKTAARSKGFSKRLLRIPACEGRGVRNERGVSDASVPARAQVYGASLGAVLSSHSSLLQPIDKPRWGRVRCARDDDAAQTHTSRRAHGRHGPQRGRVGVVVLLRLVLYRPPGCAGGANGLSQALSRTATITQRRPRGNRDRCLGFLFAIAHGIAADNVVGWTSGSFVAGQGRSVPPHLPPPVTRRRRCEGWSPGCWSHSDRMHRIRRGRPSSRQRPRGGYAPG